MRPCTIRLQDAIRNEFPRWRRDVHELRDSLHPSLRDRQLASGPVRSRAFGWRRSGMLLQNIINLPIKINANSKSRYSAVCTSHFMKITQVDFDSFTDMR